METLFCGNSILISSHHVFSERVNSIQFILLSLLPQHNNKSLFVFFSVSVFLLQIRFYWNHNLNHNQKPCLFDRRWRRRRGSHRSKASRRSVVSSSSRFPHLLPLIRPRFGSSFSTSPTSLTSTITSLSSSPVLRENLWRFGRLRVCI